MMSYLGKFSAALSARRVSIKDDGNTEVYSNNESFHEGVLWKLSILTPKPDNEFEVTGQIEKLQDGVPVPFELEEAKSAIYGTFFQVSTFLWKIALSNWQRSFPKISLLG